MRRLPLFVALAFLVLAWPAMADEAPDTDVKQRLTVLEGKRLYYEKMLRDAQTDTAARYFMERVKDLEQQIKQLEQAIPALESEAAPPPAADLTQRTDAWLRKRILKKVSEPDIALTDVAAWTRRELPEELTVWWAESLGESKPITLDAAREAWEGRLREGWLAASYGSGTYIVLPPKRKPPRRGARTGSGAQVEVPKPPTRDGWWAKTPPRERMVWTLAYFAERSALFEVGERMYKPCPACQGKGVITKRLQGNKDIEYLCPRCGGAQQDVTVRYR